jgi:CRISPR/Cas system-associated exonuclease Cas4 (RecB family)
MEVMGYNYVVCNLIEKYIHKILLYDLSIAPFRYIESEKRFYTTLKLDDGTEVKLKAFVDRIDRLNGELRIVDYKTGGNPDKMISISSLFEPNSAKKISVFFQLFLYAFMVNPNNNSLLSPYFLRELGTRFDKTAGPVELNEFKEHLVSKIAEILNPQIPFGQTENIKSCDYCPFKQICR